VSHDCVCCRVGQEDVDIRLSGQFIKELHCVFCSEVNENNEGESSHMTFITFLESHKSDTKNIYFKISAVLLNFLFIKNCSKRS